MMGVAEVVEDGAFAVAVAVGAVKVRGVLVAVDCLYGTGEVLVGIAPGRPKRLLAANALSPQRLPFVVAARRQPTILLSFAYDVLSVLDDAPQPGRLALGRETFPRPRKTGASFRLFASETAAVSGFISISALHAMAR